MDLTPLSSKPLAPSPWLTFLLPFFVYMIVGSLEPAAPKPLTDVQLAAPEHIQRQLAEGTANRFGLRYKHYPIIYTVKIALTIAAMLYVLPATGSFRFASRRWRSASAWSASCSGSGSAACTWSRSCSARSAWTSFWASASGRRTTRSNN